MVPMAPSMMRMRWSAAFFSAAMRSLRVMRSPPPLGFAD